MQGTNNRYHGDDLQPAGSRDADGRCGGSEERAAEVDTLFPRCDKHSLLGQPEWVRSMSSGGQRCGEWMISKNPSVNLLTLVRQNQMQDAMTIWDSICHSQWFKQTSIVS